MMAGAVMVLLNPLMTAVGAEAAAKDLGASLEAVASPVAAG